MVFLLRPGSGWQLKAALTHYKSQRWVSWLGFGVSVLLITIVSVGSAYVFDDGIPAGFRVVTYLAYILVMAVAVSLGTCWLVKLWAKRTVAKALVNNIAAFQDRKAFEALYRLMETAELLEFKTEMNAWLTSTAFDKLLELSHDAQRPDSGDLVTGGIMLKIIRDFKTMKFGDSQSEQEQPA